MLAKLMVLCKVRDRILQRAIHDEQGTVIFLCALAWWGCGAAHTQALDSPGLQLEQQQLQRQQERDRALRERIAPEVDALPGPSTSLALVLPQDESPCFALHAIRITGTRASEVPWLEAAAGLDLQRQPCVGARGVEVILARLQHALVARGFITSRVLAGPQNLQPGVLEIAFIPGVLREVRLHPDSPANASILGALPARPGAMLQLRDIEQGLENLKRVPTADADIEIVPSEGPGVLPGQSDLVVSYRRSRPLRFHFALDDGGTRSTGRLQGTAHHFLG